MNPIAPENIKIINDFSTPYWVRENFKILLAKDPVDAWAYAKVLAKMMDNQLIAMKKMGGK